MSGSSREALGVQHHAAFGLGIVSRSASKKTSCMTTKLKIDVSAACDGLTPGRASVREVMGHGALYGAHHALQASPSPRSVLSWLRGASFDMQRFQGANIPERSLDHDETTASAYDTE